MLLTKVLRFLVVFTLGLYLIVDGQENEVETDNCNDELDAFSSEFDPESSDGSNVLVKHIGIAMRLGNWVCAKEIVQLGQKHDIINTELKNVFELEQRSIVKEIAALRTVIESSLPMSTVAPAFQWAQTPKEILLNIKFSHKIDAPATLNVEVTNITTQANSFSMIASDGRKNFKLSLELLREVVPEETRYDMGSVGRMTVTLAKAGTPRKWNRLTKSKEKKNHMHIWWEMAEKYRAEVDRLEDDENEEDSGNKKKKGKTAATATADVPDASSATTDNKAATAPDTASSSDAKPSTLTEEFKKIDKQTKDELKAVDEESKKRKLEIDAQIKASKAELDAKAKEDKKKVDVEILERKQRIENAAMARKQELEKKQKESKEQKVSADITVEGVATS